MGAGSLDIGSRIHCEGEFATVLYVGQIAGLEGVWLGVEWDNTSRGKHSGCYNGVTYFTTRTPNAGSFIKISKADIGISCPEAMKFKYGKDIASNKPPNFVNLPQNSGMERHIEMVGFEKIMGKQSNFAVLAEVVLYGMLVNGAGATNELKELAPFVNYLDLSRNLLSSWLTVNEIVKQLSHLSTLIVSKNCLKILEQGHLYREIYQSLKTLVLDDMAYNWEEILTCAQMWPFVEELYVQNNGLSTLSIPVDPIFSQLKFLSLDNNPIKCWLEINKLGTLTNLEELHLDNTSMDYVEFPNVPHLEKTDLFPNLKILFLKNNNLRQWTDIGELNKLKSLMNIGITKNPIIQSVNSDTARQIIIAKISSLTIFNRSQIERSERRGAELDYLKRYRSEWILSGSSLNPVQNSPSGAFLKEHPTYTYLLEKHGAADENEVKTQSTLIKDNLLCLRIFSPLKPEKPMLTKKLPAEMTVGKLKALVQRIFKVAAHEVTLTHIFNENESVRTEMDNNLKQLSFYSISDQDKISVEW